MKKRINLKKQLISVLIILIFMVFVGILVYQYTILFGLRKQNKELKVNLDSLNSEISQKKENIEEYKNIMNDSTLLDDYAEHNGYFDSEEVYIIQK